MGFRFSIRNKILFSFIFLILIIVLLAAYSVTTLRKSIDQLEESVEVINPLHEALNEYVLMANRSKMLATNWVYLQSNNEDKEALKKLHDVEYPELKNRVINLTDKLESSNLNFEQNIDSVFLTFEELFAIEKEVMASLQTFDDYDDPIKKFTAEDVIQSEVIPRSEVIIQDLQLMIESINTAKKEYDLSMVAQFGSLINTTVGLNSVLIIIGLLLAVYLSRSIITPLNRLKSIIDSLSKGEVVEMKNASFSNDELGDMTKSVDKLLNSYTESANFAAAVGDGNYATEFETLGENDILGNALLDMRDNLKEVAEEDTKRNWANTGMAKFGELLRTHSSNFEQVADDIISELVKYLDANQGALFIVEEDTDDGEPYMSMAACYAWDKKKYFEKKVHKGEGLSGQSWIEGDTIYLTDIPDEYVKITSGLGSSNPRSVLIVPLKINEEIFGVIEIASFHPIEKYQQEFVERISESIASTISFLKSNQKTQKLLKESTMMTEQMRAQEEEMRQNMEEMQATQEKITRDQKEQEAREAILMNTSIILELSNKFQIRKATGKIEDTLMYSESEVEGIVLKDILLDTSVLKTINNSVKEGKSWVGLLSMKNKEGRHLNAWASAGSVEDGIHGGELILMQIIVLDQLEGVQS